MRANNSQRQASVSTKQQQQQQQQQHGVNPQASSANSQHMYFNNGSQSIGQNVNQQYIAAQASGGNNQFVHQVIYNQGSVVINNPGGTPTITYPVQQQQQQTSQQLKLSQGATQQKQSKHISAHSASVALGHQNYGQNSLLQSQESKMQQQQQWANFSNSGTNISANQAIQVQPAYQGQPNNFPSHKKSQSMVQSKISHLLTKGGKQVQNPSISNSKNNLERAQEQKHTTSDLQEILNRSMDNMLPPGHKRQIAHQDDSELMRVLLDQKQLQELSYQNEQFTVGSRDENTSFQQFMGKHNRAATHATNTLMNNVNELQQSTSYTAQKKVRPPSSKVAKQELMQSQIKSKQQEGKIASSGKVFASGAVVKKPASKIAQQQIQPKQPQHHRIKSDQHYSQKTKEIQGINTVMNQKGKVGQILKDNFVDSSLHNQPLLENGPKNPAHQSFAQVVTQPPIAKTVVNRTFQQPPSQIVNTQPSIVPSNHQLLQQLIQTQNQTSQQMRKDQSKTNPSSTNPSHRKKSSTKVDSKSIKHSNNTSQGHSQTTSAIQQNSNQTAPSHNISKEQQQELQDLYNKLIKKHGKAPEPDVQTQVRPASHKRSHAQTSQNTSQHKQAQINNVQQQFGLLIQNQRVKQQHEFQNVDQFENRTSSWDNSKSQQKQLTTQQHEQQQQNLGLKVPPQSSSSSLRQQQHAQQSKSLSLNTKKEVQHKFTIINKTRESQEKLTPISSAKGSTKLILEQQHQPQVGKQMRDSMLQKKKEEVDMGKNPRRSLSNGSNDSARFKFNKSVNGVPQFSKNHLTDFQNTSNKNQQPVILQRSTLSQRDQSLGQQQRAHVYHQSPQQQVGKDLSPNSSKKHIRQQSANTKKQLARPKSKTKPSIQHTCVQTLSSNQSPRFNYAADQSPDEQQRLSIKMKARQIQEQIVTQPMVILENSPETNTPIQLSEWDRMISQNFKRQQQQQQQQQPAMVNNLVSGVDQSKKKLKPSEVQKYLLQQKPGHQKNKYSAQSENVQGMPFQLVQNSQPQLHSIPSNEPKQSQKASTKSTDVQNRGHKRVKSDIPVSQKQQMIILNNFVQQESELEQPNNNFIRNRLEANPINDQKQFNISVEQILFNEDEEVTDNSVHHHSQVTKNSILQQKSSQQAQNQKQKKPVGMIEQKKVQKIVVAPHNRLKSDVVQNNQQPLILNISEEQKQKKKLERKDSAPKQKDIQANAPLNSVAQSKKQSPKKKEVDDWRIETQDSVDSSCSPRERQHCKVVKYIKKYFKTNVDCPSTTVDFYRVGKVLGKGAFGKVNIALQVIAKQLVAIKSINTSHFKDENQSKKVMQEVLILKQIRHPNIVRLYEYFQTQKHVLIVIELSSGGDLLSYVRKRRQLKEDVAKSVFKQLVSAIQCCHSKSILHRDIKLDNILLTVEGGVKLCDFGVSKQVKPGERMTEQCGTPAYIAPEILVDKGYEGFAIDIWSAGVVLYAMLYGTVPFKANNMTELQKMIIKANYTLADGISKDAKDLLQALLEKDPLQRITIQGIFNHVWMRDAKDNVELFTPAEKNYMIQQILQSHDMAQNPSGDFFSDQMFQSHQQSLKNAETKSIILAPFNSTRSNLKEIEKHYSLPSEIRDLIQSKSCLKFNHKGVREIDKQYEVNNNELLDNGVYHDFNIEKEDSLQSDFRESQQDNQKGRPSDGEQLQKLEKMLQQQEPQPLNTNTSTSALAIQDKPEEIDEEVLKEVASYGYNPATLRKYLQGNELNNATTTYYLLCSKKQSNILDTTTQQKKQ